VADHRREQILDAIVSQLTGLTTTSTRVFRGRAYPLADTDLPAILIYQGEDNPTSENSSEAVYQFIDSTLTVAIEACAMSTSTVVDQILNQIDKEAWIALMSTLNLGLSFVHYHSPIGAQEPRLSGEGERPIGCLRRNWTVYYRSSRTDPSA